MTKSRGRSYSTEDLLPEVYAFGQRLIDLGQALQDRRTHLEEAVRLAGECGMTLGIGLTPLPQSQTQEPKAEK